MPKRRRTKVTAKTAVYTSDINNSSDEERQHMLDLYIKDFDMRVANCLKQADNEAKALSAAVNHAFMVELFKLPKNIREMTRSEFMAQGGYINDTMLHKVTGCVDTIASSISTKSLASSGVELSDGSSANDENECKTKTKITTKKKVPKARKKTVNPSTSVLKNQVVNTHEPMRRSTRKTAQGQMVTPVMRMGKVGALSTGWDTPMITPKFDPRLPVTPANCYIREAKKGETIMSMSGSPLSMPEQCKNLKPEAVIPLANGTSLKIGVQSPDFHMAMDTTTRSNILLLQSNLAKILQKCPVKK